MEKLEARLNAKIADERERIFKTIAKVVADGIFEPYEKRIAEMQEESTTRRRDPVSVTAAAINHKGELMLTFADGTILTPGRIGREAEVLDLPNPLQQGACDDARGPGDRDRRAGCRNSKCTARLASAIYEVVETELRKQLQERQLAANPRKDDR